MIRTALIAAFVGGVGVISAQGRAPAQAVPAFEVASVKLSKSGDFGYQSNPRPGGYNATNVSLLLLIRFAYNLKDYEVVGGPDWVQTDRFDIAARAGRDVSNAELRVMMRSLLADRFKLVVRSEQRQIAQFAMVLARSDGRLGLNLERRADDCDSAGAPSAARERPPFADAGFTMRCGSMSGLSSVVAENIQAPVVDKTGLDGKWDVAVFFRSDRALVSGTTERPASAPSAPSLFDALSEQLGLKLERMQGAVAVVRVIDSVQRPTPD